MLKVKAVRRGVYGSVRIKEGTVFDIKNPAHFDATWMEPVAERVLDEKTEAAVAKAKKARAAERPEPVGLSELHATVLV